MAAHMAEPARAVPAADALPVQREATLGFRVARLTIGPLFRLLFRLRVTGMELAPTGGPYVLIGPREGELLPFRKGFAHFAVEAGVPVLPVALSGTKDLWLGKRIELRVGGPIPADGLGVDALADLARQRVQELLPAYVEPPSWKPLRRRLTRLLY